MKLKKNGKLKNRRNNSMVEGVDHKSQYLNLVFIHKANLTLLNQNLQNE